MDFLHPELLLLLVPALLAWWWLRDSELGTRIVRLVVVLLLGLALAGPVLRTSGTGRDLVLLVDRSRSMPEGSDDAIAEAIRLAEEARGEGDRVAVVAFGAASSIERLPSATERFDRFERPIDADGSDLAGALETALQLVPRHRAGSILLLSDGEVQGRDPEPVARRAFARGVRIDTRHLARIGTSDLSVERLDLPGHVATGEPFQFTTWVRSDRRRESRYVLERDGTPIGSGRRAFEEGWNRLVFRDRLDRAGTATYVVRLDADRPDAERDRIPENDRAFGAVRVAGARSILVLNHDGADDPLVRSLREAGFLVEVHTPETARLDAVSLTAHRAVVLENVAAERVRRGLDDLRDFVLERGGGLLLTGGKASFGVGGYFRSRLDELLPVSMEIRQEHRKQALALAIAMDRSGSMGVGVGMGMTKMDLANLGAAAAIELLTPLDQVGVVAVDSSPHLVQELVAAENVAAITSRVRRTTAGGGGIFTHTALLAAGRLLEEATPINRHIILFADAADSEEQEKCPELLERLGAMGVTVSVIALGTEADTDAAFLRSVAAQGGGEIYFTTDAGELPRLFAQDTLRVARASFVEEPTGTVALPDLFAMGERIGGGFPSLDGYNLTYLRPGAIAGAMTTDEYRAPAFAFQHAGLGRTAAFTGQIGGTFGGSVVAWDGFGTFFTTVVRWLAGEEEPADLFPSVRREGREAVLSVEVDPDAPRPPDLSALEARVRAPDGTLHVVPLERVEEHRYEARHVLDAEGVSLGTVRLGEDRFVTLPPIVLPYSPEFERGFDPARGERTMRRLAEESGGTVEPAAEELFRGSRAGRESRVVTRELLLAALLLLLVEIAARRLHLWSALPEAGRLGAKAASTARRAAEVAAAEARRVATTFGRTSLGRTRRVPEGTAATVDHAGAKTGSSADRPQPPSQAPSPGKAPPPATPKPDLGDALRRAKRSADRRLGR